jgi:hypothetical protein
VMVVGWWCIRIRVWQGFVGLDFWYAGGGGRWVLSQCAM